MNSEPSSAKPRIALIAGPTASGKTARALDLAKRERGTIINADASQVYAELRILTARPTPAEEARAPHRLFGYRPAAAACSAASWAADAKAAIKETLAEGRLPILVGGTGLYLRALIEGIAPIPEIDPAIRAAVRAMSRDVAWPALGREDPAAAAKLHPHDTGRIARALEVVRSTGRPIGAWQAARTGGIGEMVAIDATLLDPPVAELYARCDARFLTMIDAGAIEEVIRLRALSFDPALPAMRAIGVHALGAHLDGALPLPEAISTAQQATRNYAKRQRTWFRHQFCSIMLLSCSK